MLASRLKWVAPWRIIVTIKRAQRRRTKLVGPKMESTNASSARIRTTATEKVMINSSINHVKDQANWASAKQEFYWTCRTFEKKMELVRIRQVRFFLTELEPFFARWETIDFDGNEVSFFVKSETVFVNILLFGPELFLKFKLKPAGQLVLNRKI